MNQLPEGERTLVEQVLLRKLRWWIAGLAVACLVAGVGVGALLAGRPAVAQNSAQIARAPEALSASFVEIARRVEPAVVNIDTITAAPETAERERGADKDEDELRRRLPELFRGQPRRRSEGVGSGFIVDPKGFILTNYHVVEGTTRINVKLPSGEKMLGRVVGIDEETDLAVVKVESARDLPVVKLGNSDDTEVGDWVLAVGSPFGLEQTVTAGIISTKDRATPPGAGNSVFQRFLQTDAAINRGNSGGPLINMRGEVIGINSQIATSTGDYNGIGFALPANEAAFVYRQITSTGRVQRGYLGVFLKDVQAEFARVYSMPELKGAIAYDLDAREGSTSPAAQAGILPYDVIVEFNNQPITSAQDLINKVAVTPAGQLVPVAYLRDVNAKLERRTVSVRVGVRPPRNSDSSEDKIISTPKPKDATGRPVLGLTLSDLTAQLASDKNLRGVRGVLVTKVETDGMADDAELATNMVIQRVNRVPVATVADFERIIGALKVGDPVVMHVVRYSTQSGRLAQSIVQFTYQ